MTGVDTEFSAVYYFTLNWDRESQKTNVMFNLRERAAQYAEEKTMEMI